MGELVSKNIDTADEVRKFPAHGWMDLVQLPGLTLGRATFQAGWRWSTDIAPVAGTTSCQVHHNGFVLSGHLHIAMDDGSEIDIGPGDAFVCPPGHDAWVVGDEDCVALDFSSDIANYAKA